MKLLINILILLFLHVSLHPTVILAPPDIIGTYEIENKLKIEGDTKTNPEIKIRKREIEAIGTEIKVLFQDGNKNALDKITDLEEILFQDPRPLVRGSAAIVLASLAQDEIAQSRIAHTLAGVLINDKVRYVCAVAAEGLDWCGDPAVSEINRIINSIHDNKVLCILVKGIVYVYEKASAKNRQVLDNILETIHSEPFSELSMIIEETRDATAEYRNKIDPIQRKDYPTKQSI